MTTPPDPEADTPGKIRTWWHPLLAGVLRWQLKSPSDTLRAGDFRTLIAYALLYCAQHQPHLDPARMTLIVIAPRLSRPCEEEMRLLGVEARQEHPGVWRLQGGMLGAHPGWLLESVVLFGPDHPVLTLLSPQFLQAPVQTYEMLRRAGYTDLVVFMAQQIQQFRRLGKEFAMQHLGSEDEMAQVWHDLLATMTPDERLEGLSVEERLKGLPPEERLKGLPPEELLQALSPEERKGLKELLQQQTKADDNANPRQPI